MFRQSIHRLARILAVGFGVMLATCASAQAQSLTLSFNPTLSNTSQIVLTDPTGAYRIDITVNGGSISIIGDQVVTRFLNGSTDTPTMNISANFPMSGITFADMDDIDDNAARDSFAADVAGTWTDFGNNNSGTPTALLSSFPLNAAPPGRSFAELIARGAVSPVVLNDLAAPVEDNFVVTFQPTTPTTNFNILVDDTEGTNNIVSEYRFAATTVQVDQLTITKNASPTTITSPGLITYNMTANNSGPVTLTGVSVTDSLTQGGSGRTLTSGPTFVSGDTDGDGNIDAGETWVYSATYNATQSDIENGADLSNEFSFDTAQFDPETATAATSITQNPSLSITKQADDDTLRAAGDVITYTYTVVNNGNISIDNVSVSDVHNGSGPAPSPTNEVLLTDNAPLGDSTDGGTNASWDRIAPGDVVRFSGTYTVTQNDVDTLQ